MAVLEDVPDDTGRAGISQSTEAPASATQAVPSDPVKLAALLRAQAAALVPPDDLSEDSPDLAPFQAQAFSYLRLLAAAVTEAAWSELSLEDQSAALLPAMKLSGPPFTPSASSSAPYSPSSDPASLIVSITSSLQDPTIIALYALQHPLRAHFSSHPSLSAANRALPRPRGGIDDLHEQSEWKHWGMANALIWCASHLSVSEVERHLNLLLPPTLTMMDDWEPKWRDEGARVLASWIGKVDPAELRRRGLDTLLLKSSTHSLSLHNDPPLPHVFQVAMEIAGRFEVEKRAEAYARIVDSLIAGWTYAPANAVAVLVDVAGNTAKITDVLGTGIARWIKSIIPALLSPLVQDPARPLLPLFRANLAALLAVLRALRGTGRVDRWRGQVLDVTARAWLQVSEHGYADAEDKGQAEAVIALARDIYAEVAEQVPSVRGEEFGQLLKLSPNFATLVGTAA